ncbi:MAG: hypothetical protein ACHQT6_07725 [Candidatus Acidiferrales bacterium]
MSVLVNNEPPGSKVVHRRRSQRIVLSVPLIVSGDRASGAQFSERTTTLMVNAHGGLILLREPVLVGQVLSLTHLKTGEKLACTVKDISPGEGQTREIGVGFAHPNARFWRVSFPPVDWTSRSPEAKHFAKQSAPAAPPPAVKK